MAAVVSLVLIGIYAALTVGLRTFVQYRRTGSSGFRLLAPAVGREEWIAVVVTTVALAVGVTAPILELAAVIDPVAALGHDVVRVIGVLLYGAGLTLTLAAQFGMGASWRIGVDPEERTALVTAGLFQYARNPIFSAMVVTTLGLALLVPNLVALFAVTLLIVGVELQVRRVEEPYLLRTHGEGYAAYASRTGRFVPGVGMLRSGGRGDVR